MHLKFLSCLMSAVLALLLVACSGQHTTVEVRKGAQSGLDISTERLAQIEEKLQAEVEAGIRSGFVVMINQGGETVYETAVGLADIEQSKPMTQETQFRIASMTKPVTSLAIMMLVERGDLLLTDPVARYIPSFEGLKVATSHNYNEDGVIPTEPLQRPLTIHQLLTHTSGLGYIFDFSTDLGKEMIAGSLYTLEGDLGARIDALADFPLYSQPGTEWRYSYATDVAGRVIEVVSGKSLDAFLAEEIFLPLGMEDTGFFLGQDDFSDLAMVYIFNEAGEMVLPGRRGNNPDPNTDSPAWPSGGGGLVSTARDYMRFAQLLLNGGELDGVRLLSPATVELMMSPHVTQEALLGSFMKPGENFGLGGRVVLEPGFAGRVQAPGEFGWGGYYDTVFFVNPAYDLAAIVLAQREPGPYAPESRAQGIVKATAYGALE
ncbi:serine hydrolase [Parvularcula sp. IMCC14364]|uniref:serine hydrolase domain-containing protein n=1 Tax=Parvularcula sp. IMCC14364 TaxID=3067902 RepID=UPI002741F4B8|nr:serine hydrolase domain-containing protein [Parvularcula sp. IMCC14364]